MSDILIGFLSAVLATNTPAALSNLVHQKTGLAVPVADSNDPVERDYNRILEEDDQAMADIDGWIQESQARQGSDQERAVQKTLLNARIKQRLDGLEKTYEAFLTRHPNHTGARMAYGSFLNDSQREAAAAEQWEKVRQMDPADAAAWNNLANHYGHNGPIEKAFDYYAKAIELEPAESVYYHNFATTVYLFRNSAKALDWAATTSVASANSVLSLPILRPS
jgi:tetratricopeptide (TPR) repeat protein